MTVTLIYFCKYELQKDRNVCNVDITNVLYSVIIRRNKIVKFWIRDILIFRIITMGGDGTVCEVLTAVTKKLQGSNITDLQALDITIGHIPTGIYII